MIPVYCPLCCDQPFEDQDGLFHHLRSLRNNLFCPICSERFSSFDLLITHLSRKCHGPVSPREAKRRCLYSNTKLPDSFEVPPSVSPSSLNSGNVQGEESVSEKTDIDGPAIPAPSSNSQDEIRRRLSLGGTVSCSPSNSPLSIQDNTPVVSSTDESLEKSVKSSSVKPKIVSDSLGVVLNQVSLNSNVDISVKSNENSSSTKKSDLFGSSPVGITTNDMRLSEQCRKAGPLSSKLNRDNTKRSVEKQTEDVSSKEGSILEPKYENKKSKETNNKPISLPVHNETTKSRPKRGNSKTTYNNNESPVINGVMNHEKPSRDTPLTRNKQTKPQDSTDLMEEVSNKRSLRPRRKKIHFDSIVISSSDESNHSEFAASCSSDDSSYEPSDNELKKELNKKEIETINKPSKKVVTSQDVTNGRPNKRSTESCIIVDLEKENIEADENNLKNKKVTEVKAEDSTEVKAGDSTSIVEKPKTAAGDEPQESSSMETCKTEEEEEYTCSACNIRFTSIYEHIKQYHNGQEVVVEVPEEEIKEDLKIYQENSQSLVSIGESETTDPDMNKSSSVSHGVVETSSQLPKSGSSSVSHGDEETSSQLPKSGNKSKDGKKRDITGFTAEGVPDDLVYTRTFKKVKREDEHWVQLQSEKRKLYQFVRDEEKYQRLMNELKNNTSIHPELKMPIKKLFESPKINVVEITYLPNSPFLTHRTLNFKNPMPMFIVDRETTNSPDMLGGIASYVMAGKDSGNSSLVVENSKVIGVMKVILASDKELTVENIVFNDKPANPDMVPVLEDVKKPDIPLLKNAKILKWKCNRCLATTWKFPLQKESHFCNACPICHKTFISPVSLKKHLVLHKRDGTRYCKDCQAAFVSKATLNSHLGIHLSHVSCDKCRLYVPRDKMDEHTDLHSRNPSEQFPCSVCKKMYSSSQDLTSHETKLCSKLVARFNCSHCDKKFFSHTAFSYHTANHKKASVKFNCRFCPKTFIQEKEQCPKTAGKRKPSSYIKKIWHERIHTRDRPYLCKSCPKRFRSIVHEAEHTTKVHTPPTSDPIPLRNVHVHMCTYCDRVFRSEKQLTSHMALHTSVDATGE